MTLMTVLGALALARRALGPRRLTCLACRGRIAGRRPRRALGVLRQLQLELLDPPRQLPDLTIHPQKHLNHGLAPRVIDRLRLTPFHTLRFDGAVLCPPTL
jgi:hypothetical protein